jgi:FkbM family methyltransferase
MRSASRLKEHDIPTANIAVLSAAVCDGNRVEQLQIAARARAANHLVRSNGSSQAGGNRNLQNTVAVSLDFLLEHFPAPSVVKIDVEGAEVGVLNGASKLLSTSRPVMWCEVDPENSETAAQILLDHDYEIYAAALPAEERAPLRRASWDTLAVPSRR